MMSLDRTDDLVALLRARGMRVTSQRLVILSALRRRQGHLTAAQVHQAVRRELPATSTPTVYATLELLAELGLVRKLDVGMGYALYDGRIGPHAHAVCRGCGSVSDLDGEIAADSQLQSASQAGFRAQTAELLVFGLCARCADKRS